MFLRRFGPAMVFALALPAAASATPRILFSHYAPGQPPVQLKVNDQAREGALAFSQTDSSYRVVDGTSVTLAVLAGETPLLERDITLSDGDNSVFFHLASDGSPAIVVSRDSLAAFSFPAPFDFETADANAAGRFLSLAHLPDQDDLVLYGTAQQFHHHNDGTTSSGGQFDSDLHVGHGPRLGGNFPATVNSRVSFTVTMELRDATDVVLGESFSLPAGTTDYVLIGDADGLQIIERPRPGARSARVDGLYGEPDIHGSGLQLHELPEIGRVFGFLYSYDDKGEPTWYYLDSRCDLDRGFQCTTPGLVVATGSYLVALYQTRDGMLAPGFPAAIELVGAGRLRVARQNTYSTSFAQPESAAELTLYLEPPMPGAFPFGGTPDAHFQFQLIRR